MAKQKKILERLCAKPPPSDFTWNELKTLLTHLGYTLLTASGSRRKFVNKKTKALIICHEPHPSPNVDKGCIVDVAEHLRIHNLI